jgi:hypothetical protein
MAAKTTRRHVFLEALLILICLSLCCLLYQVGSYRVVVLNLFFLPVVLSAFLIGRYGAGILALLCVVGASAIVAMNLSTFAANPSPLVTGLALTAWGAVLGITSILVGTLSDESTRKIDELHDAYLGVMEVLVQYLNSGDAQFKGRAIMLSSLSQQVAARMGLSDAEIDNIRVAAMLQDIENVEVTARVIRKAVGTLSRDSQKPSVEHTFHGSDLIRSFSMVLTGALPLLVDHGDCLHVDEARNEVTPSVEPSLGRRLIATVRRYLTLLSDEACLGKPRLAIAALKRDLSADHHPMIIHALEQVVLRSGDVTPVDEVEALTAANSFISLLLGTSSGKRAKPAASEPPATATTDTRQPIAEEAGTAGSRS